MAKLLTDSDVALDRLTSPSWGLYSFLSTRKRVELEAASLENCLQRLQVGNYILAQLVSNVDILGMRSDWELGGSRDPADQGRHLPTAHQPAEGKTLDPQGKESLVRGGLRGRSRPGQGCEATRVQVGQGEPGCLHRGDPQVLPES